MAKLRCICHKCGVEVPVSVLEHFTAVDGRILCEKCAVGEKPITEQLRKRLFAIENKGFLVNVYNFR